MATVFVAIDDSKFAENAFKCYAEHFHRPGNKVVLLHVIENLVDYRDMSPGRIIELQAEAKKEAQTLKEKYSTMAKQLGVEAEVRVETAEKPAHAIVQMANKENATFIVTGSRGMGVVRRTILGSTSDFILHHAKCPVFVYKMDQKNM
ncbi:universal stress protein in QAH/OAS sulfhydrylase 3'region-like [Saccostrea echinata]|uniref:universal stress protein in QAH/OAS sulfhydrylase 3'region-like n=1 Tax=Saccostrea echinata TaxID=191078 RepID=UPI002A7F76A1|nr:universal stress protein in QAH/OAS sulfhydrylase 3'region-like [Saccostrea echinata]